MIQQLRVMKLYEETKTLPTNFNEKKANCKTQSFYILFVFLLITIIYCCLIKYQANQKHLLPFHFINYVSII